MKITRWEVEGYRSIDQASFEPSNLNIIVGRNNTGKSSVIKSITETAHYITSSYPIDILQTVFSGASWNEVITRNKSTEEVVTEFEFCLSEAEQAEIIDRLDDLDVGNSYINLAMKHDAFSRLRYTHSYDGTRHRKKWETDLPEKGFHTIFDNINNSINLDVGELPPVESNNSHRDDSFNNELKDMLAESMTTWKFASAFREPEDVQPASRSNSMTQTGQNLVQVLDTMARNYPDQFEKVEETYVDIMEGVVGIRTPFVSNEQTTVVVDEQGHISGFSLDEISAGSKEILTLITLIVKAEATADILLIEEPELHLHPGAQDSFYNLIREVTEGDGPQIFLTTHSEVFLDETDSSNIVTVSRDVTTEIGTATSDIGELLGPDGREKSNVIQSRAVAFVEGVSDKSVLEEFSETLSEDGERDSLDDLGVVLRPLGGDRIRKHGGELHNSFGHLRIPHVFVVDSDDEDPDEKQDELKSVLNGAEVKVLEEYCIESYLLENPYAIAEPFNMDEEHVSEYIADTEGRPNKKRVLNDLMKDIAGREGGYDEREHSWTIARNVRAEDIPAELDELIERLEALAE